jgi:sugar lactone lactonase YvrE
MKKITTTLLICLATFAATAQTAKIYDFAGNYYLGNGYSGDGGHAVAAQLYSPSAVIFDAAGNQYISDSYNGCVRMVNTSGIISTFAGNHGLGAGYSGDGGLATAAQLSNDIRAFVFDGAGNLYIADNGNNVVRIINTAGIITTFAGGGTGGDGGSTGVQASNATLNGVGGLAYDPTQFNLYISETGANTIQSVNINTLTMYTYIGNGTSGNSSDGSLLADAELYSPRGLATDAAHNIYIADAGNNRVRVTAPDGVYHILNDFAGNSGGANGFSGDAGQATAAKLNGPNALCFDAAGNVYISDAGNNRIRKVNTSGIITTITGFGTSGFNMGYVGDAIVATTAQLNSPSGVACDASGNVYIADNNNNEVREITTTCIPPTIISQPASTTVCVGSNASFLVSWANSTGYQWQVNKGAGFVNNTQSSTDPGTYIDTVNIAYVPMSGWQYHCIVKGCSNVTSNAATLTISTPTIICNTPNICAGSGGSATLTASGASSGTYNWSTGDNTDYIVESPTVTTTYTVTGNDNTTGCNGTGTGTITVLQPQVPSICMVTTDTSFTHNIIYWEHTLYSRVDSFIVYRYDVTSASYLRLGAVGKDSSQFTDIYPNIGGPNGGDPQITAWQYKIAIKDSCGNIGTQSPYHQTVNVQQNNQNITWNAYAIEGESNPVSGYQVLRDSLGIGNWHIFVNTSGLSTNDPNYALYPNANYLVNAEGFTCNPALRLANGNNSTFAAKVVSHSNSNNNRETTSIKKVAGSSQVNIYPNPNNGTFVIEPNDITNQTIQMYDVNGKLVLSQSINGKTSIDASGLNEGVYNLSIISNNGIVNKRLVIVR